MPTRFTWCCFSTKHPSPARELLLLCVYTCMIRSHERRALGALVSCSLTSRSEPASTETASCSLAAVRRGDCVRASWLYSIHSPTHRSLLVLVLLCVPRTGAVPCRLCSARFLLWSGRKNKYGIIIRAKSKQAYCAEMVLGSFFFSLV